MSEPLYHCSICGEDKPRVAFYVEANGRPFRQCIPCRSLYNSMRVKGKHPTHAEVRAKLLGGATFVGALHKARHWGKKAKAKPLSTAAREELRERREEAEGKPSMCYLLGMEGSRAAVKIGHSTNVFRRMAQIQAGNPFKLKVMGLLPGGQVKEQELHRKFMRYHRPEHVGEWFAHAPAILNEFAVGRPKEVTV